MAPEREIFRTKTDSAWRCELRIERGTGDYLLYIGAQIVSRFASVRCAALPPTPSSPSMRGSAPASRPLRQVAPSRLARPTRFVDPMNDPAASGGVVMGFGGVPGALSPDQMGDVNAMALTIPVSR